MDTALLWKHTLSEIEVEIGKNPTLFHFRNTRLVKNNNSITIFFPNDQIKSEAEKRYANLIKDAFSHQLKVSSNDIELIFATSDNSSKAPHLFSSIADDNSEQVIKTDSNLFYQKAKLLPKYTFDKFIVGTANNLAHAAALGVVKNPGTEYNPLFIYGGVGVGKTHLMQAIGNELFKNNSRLSILYTSSENFMNEFIESLKTKTTDQFKKKYRTLDLLMIDDIQFISGAEATQDEIFHTFNTLHQQEKQIILTSDRRPEEINKVQSRIISRFMGGLTVDIQPPDLEMRTAIIKEKLESKGVVWNKEVIDYMAQVVQGNIRELEGILTNIFTLTKVKGFPVTLDFLNKHFGVSIKRAPTANVSAKTIIATVAKHCGIKPSEILSDKRDNSFALPRQIAMFFLREKCKIKLTDIAKLLNRKDHTTVIHAVDKINNLLKTDFQIKQQVDLINNELWGQVT